MSQRWAQFAHGLQDFKHQPAAAGIAGVQLGQAPSLPRIEREVPGVYPGGGELRLGSQDYIALPEDRQHGDEERLVAALCFAFRAVGSQKQV